MSLSEDLRYPLSWPADKPRTPRRERCHAPFGVNAKKTQTLANQCELLGKEMVRLGVGSDWLLSSNLALKINGLPYARQPRLEEDCGIAVYLTLFDRPHVFACDAWLRPEHNIRAIVKHIEALRGQERWGVGSLEQAFRGHARLEDPDKRSARHWRTVMGLEEEAVDRSCLKSRYRALAAQYHPDNQKTGDAVRFKEVATAYTAAKLEILY